MFRVGFGNDVHRLVSGRPLIIGGVSIQSELGAEGHSDADVLLHAITDALLGALALGDIGSHFPNSDERWRNVESSVFLRYAVGLMKQHGYEVANVDSTVDIETPKLRPYIDEMRKGIADALEVETNCVSIKAKTGEGVDAVGTSVAIRAEAVVLIRWSE
ncbi:MAG: 2-C-methyl-D-erythritol 2,4-cyclodiphosphate synthase [Pyrinomonadaceae bacterium]|nr:2-C-methyl-D-erythritol 2,4-cyclodiphosphate synthase [Pyrinomonadaceae bacterium]